MNDNHKVAICLTTYNRSEILESSIQNILDQSFENFELFIIDDCSNEHHSLENSNVIQKFNDGRINFIMNEYNRGLAYNRNLVISKANAAFFTFKDDDDKWDIDFLKIMVREAIKCSYPVDVILTGYINKSTGQVYSFTPKYLSLFQCFLSGYTPPVGGQLYNLSVVKSVGGYSDIKTGVDHDLWVNLVSSSLNINVLFIEQSLVIPDAFVTLSGVKMTNDFNKRVSGIRASLDYWQEKLVRTFGPDFFEHFKKQYNKYLCKRFLVFSIKNRKIRDLLKIFLDKELSKYFLSSLISSFLSFTLQRKQGKSKKLLPLFDQYKI